MKRLLLRLLKLPTSPPQTPGKSGSTAEAFRASKKYLYLRVVSTLLGMLGSLPLLLFSVPMVWSEMVSGELSTTRFSSWFGIAIILIILTVIFFLFFRIALVYVDYSLRYYIVSDRAIRIREGALFLHEATYTLENIQNVRIHRSFIDRFFGLSNVEIQTAGGGSVATGSTAASPHTGVIRGIENAEEIKSLISSLLKKVSSSGLGDETHLDHRSNLTPQIAYGHKQHPGWDAIVDELRTMKELTKPN